MKVLLFYPFPGANQNQFYEGVIFFLGQKIKTLTAELAGSSEKCEKITSWKRS
jgi:hypothetical protein